MQVEKAIDVESADAMEALGSRISRQLSTLGVVYLRGDLGAGKTTLVRGMLRGLGYTGAVKSPTFALHEAYSFNDITVDHLDLYRLQDPEELEFLAIRDLINPAHTLLIEWPEQAHGFLPSPDLEIIIKKANNGRCVYFESYGKAGCTVVGSLQ